MNTINREHFEAWLFSQPDERLFNYTEGFDSDRIGCVMCNFLRENTSIYPFAIGYGTYAYGVGINQEASLPTWFVSIMALRSGRYITAKEVKSLYLQEFPNAIVGNPQPMAIAKPVEQSSIAKATNGSLTNVEFAIQTIK